jgi:hypothetical protein
MRNAIKKITALSMCFIMILVVMSAGSFAGIKASATSSGYCGNNVTWSFNSDTGELIISGTGAMKDYPSYSSSSAAPWWSYRDKITKVTIEDGVTSIGECAFRGCTGLTSITLPDSVTSIGRLAFDECTGLTSITIPNSVTSIGDSAFSCCTGLTSITIGNRVTSIGSEAFYNCTNLKTVYYTGNIAKWCAIDFCNHVSNPTFYASELYINGSKVKGDVEIPNGVTSIGGWAFYNCTGLTSITIPDSVTSIGGGAFYNCTGLTSITLPDSVTSIEMGAFGYCTSLTSITISDSVTSIGEGAFYRTGLTSVKIPSTVKEIDAGAFGAVTYDFFSGFTYFKSFTIYCEKDSAAQRYAEAMGLTCVLVNDASTGNNSSNGSNSGSSSLSFFQRIIAFFKGIFESIKNLFS